MIVENILKSTEDIKCSNNHLIKKGEYYVLYGSRIICAQCYLGIKSFKPGIVNEYKESIFDATYKYPR